MSSCLTFTHKSKFTNSRTKISNFTFAQFHLVSCTRKKIKIHVFTTDKMTVHAFRQTTGEDLISKSKDILICS